MKKILMMFAVALIVSGAIWAQSSASDSLADGPYIEPFLTLWAAPTQSTEKRYSAGTFSSYVDDFVDPTAFNGQIGTFMFAGGFPGSVSGATDPLTSFVRDHDKDTLSVGFAKSFGANNYLGIYYGGFLADASGFKVMGDKDADPVIKNVAEREAVWRNNLAVLFGVGSVGITLDLVMDNTTEKTETVDGKTSAQSIGNAPTIALGFGALINDNMTPWLKIGFKLPDTMVQTNGGAAYDMIPNPAYNAAKEAAADDPTDPNYDPNYDPDTPAQIRDPNSTRPIGTSTPDKKATHSSGATFGLNAGVWYGMNETSSVLLDLSIGAVFPDSHSGDTDVLGQDPWTEGGAFGADLYFKYTKSVAFGDVNVKFKPNVSLTFITLSYNDSRSDDKFPSDNWFTLGAGVDVGAEYVYDKIGLYTGLGLRCFEWNTFGHMGGKDKDEDSAWTFTGLNWDDSRFGPGGNLGFGLTFTPIEGLVFGTGLNMGALFNPVVMTVGSASRAGYAGFWENSSLSITVSYTFANKAKEAKAEGTQTQTRAGSAQQDEGFAE